MKENLQSLSTKIKDRLAKQKLDAFEIYIEKKRGTLLEVKNGARDVLEHKAGLGFAVRVLKEGRLGFSYGFDFSELAIDQVIANACGALVYQKKDDLRQFAKDQNNSPRTIITQDEHFDQTTLNEKIEFLLEVEKSAKSYDKRIRQVVVAGLDDEKENVYFENSLGLCRYSERTATSLSLGIEGQGQQDSETAYEMVTKMCFADLHPSQVVEPCCWHLTHILDGKPSVSKQTPVILYRDVALEFLEILSLSFLGDQIFKKVSKLGSKRGQKIFSDSIHLMDDPHRPGGMGSCVFDGEGMPTQPVVLIEGGVVKDFAYDLYWGAKVGRPSTGSSERGDITCLPGLSFHNLILKPGFQSFSDLLKTMNHGLVVTDVFGLHSADSSSGDFSVGIQGFHVHQGEFAGALRSNVMTGNLFNMLSHEVVLASDLVFSGGLASPSLLIKNVDISGA